MFVVNDDLNIFSTRRTRIEFKTKKSSYRLRFLTCNYLRLVCAYLETTRCCFNRRLYVRDDLKDLPYLDSRPRLIISLYLRIQRTLRVYTYVLCKNTCHLFDENFDFKSNNIVPYCTRLCVNLYETCFSVFFCQLAIAKKPREPRNSCGFPGSGSRP